MVVVALDPGHGGTDNGTTEGGLCEKALTLQIAKKLHKALSRSGGNLDPILLRTDDQRLSQAQRGALSKEMGAGFVLSLHIDSRPGAPDDHGLVCYHHPCNLVSQQVAQNIAKAAPQILHNRRPIWGTASNDWRKNAHAVVCAHRAGVVLVEMCFATNVADVLLIQTAEVQDQIVDACVRGLAVIDHPPVSGR